MDKSKKLELLDNIILATKSQNGWSQPSETKHFEFSGQKLDVKNCLLFSYDLKSKSNEYPKRWFKIHFYKLQFHHFFKNSKDNRSKYLLSIHVQERYSTYSSHNQIDTINYDSSDSAKEFSKLQELSQFLTEKRSFWSQIELEENQMEYFCFVKYKCNYMLMYN